jgi:hypothetical protein
MEHPDHQTGMVSEWMIRARMCEEIEELRARVAELEFRLTPRRPTMPDPVVRPRRAKEAKP